MAATSAIASHTYGMLTPEWGTSVFDDRDFPARIRDVNPCLDHVGVLVVAFVERAKHVDGNPHDVVTFRNTSDVHKLPDKLFVVPITPSGCDSLEPAIVSPAPVVTVLERVFKAETLFVSGDNQGAV